MHSLVVAIGRNKQFNASRQHCGDSWPAAFNKQMCYQSLSNGNCLFGVETDAIRTVRERKVTLVG